MRPWVLLLVSVLLIFGAHGKANTASDATPEDMCCASLLVEGDGGSLDAFGRYRLPTPCGGEPNAVACPKLGFHPAGQEDDSMTASWLAFQQQVSLRTSPSCSPMEWEKRCPPGATMLLAEKRRGGCRAAGCVAMGGELNDVRNTQEGETEILRVVTAEQVALLQAANPSLPKTFFMHVVGQQRAFSKEKKQFARKLAKATKTSPPSDIELVRALVVEASTKGFRSAEIDEATKAVAKHDDREHALASFRSLPRAFVRQVAKASLVVERHSKKQRNEIVALQRTNQQILATAASDKERSTRTERDLLAQLDTAKATIASLTDTVAEQQLAAEIAAERSEIALLQLNDELETLQEDAEASLEFCEHDLEEVGSAAVVLSRFTAQKTNRGAPLGLTTYPVEEVAAWGMYDRSASHEAAQMTRARLDAVRRMVDASTSRWEDDKATSYLKEAEAREREVELHRLLDSGEEMQKELEEELAECEQEMDKIQTDADSCAADFEDIHSRSVDLVRTLEEDVANKAVWVGGLVSAGPKAPGREGSAYDLIRTSLESAQQLAFTVTSTLVEDLIMCRGEKAEARDREAKTEERRKGLEEELAECEQLVDDTLNERSDAVDRVARAEETVEKLEEDLAVVDRMSLVVFFSVEEVTFQVGVSVPRQAASELEVSNVFTIANRADRVEGTQQQVLDRRHPVDAGQTLGARHPSPVLRVTKRSWVSCTEGLTSVDRVSLDVYFSVEEVTFQVGVSVPRQAASDLEASNVFSIANRDDRVEETQETVLDRLRSRFEDMQEMAAAVLSNMRSCTGEALDDSEEPSEGNGSASVSDSGGDVNLTGVDTGGESTASPGDGTGLDPKEGDDAANEENVGAQEAEAQGVDADPPTTPGV
ncbi:unnamed protein product, partial [Ectocarpus fasciculatus]